MTQKKVLIAGGAGFIGSEVNKMLNDAGYETVVFDNLSQGIKKRVKWGTFIKGDIGNRRALDKLFNTHKFDTVMHFAALINVGDSIDNPGKYYTNNVFKTLILLEAMKDYQIKNFIFSSSAAVYGIPQSKMITENHLTNPINPYGQTKLMVEKILDDFEMRYGLKSIKLRYFNAAGGDPDGKIPNYHQNKTNLIPIILHAIKNKQPVTIFGTDYPTSDGTCIRDYIHIYDLGSAHIAAMEKLQADGKSEVYNLGNGQGHTIREVLRAAEKVTQQKIQVIEGARRPGDPSILLADSHKAHQELSWKIRYPELESMIEHAWKGYVLT